MIVKKTKLPHGAKECCLSSSFFDTVLIFFFFLDDDINDVKETGEVGVYRERLKLVLHIR